MEGHEGHIGCLLIMLLLLAPMGCCYLLVEREIVYGILWLLPPMIHIVYIKFRWPHWKREKALHKMHNYPESINLEFGNQWKKEFQSLLSKAIESTKDPEKKSDLEHCLHIVEKIKDDSGFYHLQRTFRLTGCHISITDSNGKHITEIV
ncbi:MAG: hypothetical protein IJ826_08580 [Bacteroidaceae bacterium]|nr:hypothetical protein [Bacteroidaceae bacterium]